MDCKAVGIDNFNCQSSTTQCSYYTSYYSSYFMPLTFTLNGVNYTVPSSAYLVDNLNNVTCQVMVT